MPDSARHAPLGVQLLNREQIALAAFERRRTEFSDASLRLINACVELRDARAALQTQ